MEAWRKLLPIAWLLVMIIVSVECAGWQSVRTDEKPCGNVGNAEWCTEHVDLKWDNRNLYKLKPKFLDSDQPGTTKPMFALYESDNQVSYTGNKKITATLNPDKKKMKFPTFSVKCLCVDVGNTKKVTVKLFYPDDSKQTFKITQQCESGPPAPSYWCKACIEFKGWKTVNKVQLKMNGINGLIKTTVKGVRNLFMRACRPGQP